jgi:hypothetical protein
MEFLKELFSDKALTFDELVQALNAHNGNEANKEKQIKLANLASGEYVSKEKLDRIQETLTGKETELTNANDLIAQLEKSSKGNEQALNQIAEYKAQAEQLQTELAETKLKSAIKVALLSEKAVDVDYLTFKLNEQLKEKGETLELDENDNIKGWDSRLTNLKTQYPSMFGSGEGGGDFKPYNPEGLPKGEGSNNKLTKEELLKKTYAERNEIFQKDPEAYRAAMNS